MKLPLGMNLQGRRIAVVCKCDGAQLILHEFDSRFGYDFCRSLTFPDVYELSFREQTRVSVRRTWREERT